MRALCNCGHTFFQGTLAAMTVKASGLADVNDTGGFASSSKKDSTKKRKANPPQQVRFCSLISLLLIFRSNAVFISFKWNGT